MNPITYAIKWNWNPKLIRKMIDKLNDKSVNYFNCTEEKKAMDACDKQPLVYIIKNGKSLEIADLLIEKGIDVNYKYFDRKLKKDTTPAELNKAKNGDYLRKYKGKVGESNKKQ
jgi:hypothetical protein